jgi:BON domain
MKTDKQLQEDVLAELAWEASVNAAHIGVEVDQGVVTPSPAMSKALVKNGAPNAQPNASTVCVPSQLKWTSKSKTQ